ncbi:MAG: hypothetical protein CTY20_11870 [Hyphomicrobium sp.]|nr:MAG: hypothetical protein CTY20_11870 [Hyphomicrobium sp.]
MNKLLLRTTSSVMILWCSMLASGSALAQQEFDTGPRPQPEFIDRPNVGEENGQPDAKDTDDGLPALDRGSGQPYASRDSSSAPFDPDAFVGLQSSNDTAPAVTAILAAHPDRDLLICLAGCGGGPKLVAIRSRPAALVAAAESAGQLVPSAAGMPTAAAPVREPPVGDVICLAGCFGSPGEVVQHGIRLTWVGHNANEELRTALRSIGDRLMADQSLTPAQEASGRTWVSPKARSLLVMEQLPTVLADLVRTAHPLIANRNPDLSR